jgi:hypothetical protein
MIAIKGDNLKKLKEASPSRVFSSRLLTALLIFLGTIAFSAQLKALDALIGPK